MENVIELIKNKVCLELTHLEIYNTNFPGKTFTKELYHENI